MPVAEQQKWPQKIWIVRHGQSAGNVARDEAEAAGLPLIDIALRDVDVPLSKLGERQAEALGHWFGQMRLDERPREVLYSPSALARETAQRLLEAARIAQEEVTLVADARQRQKEI